MGKKSKWEYFRAIYPRYRKASTAEKTQILEEFCKVCGYNRKYAITKLNGPFPAPKTSAKRHQRSSKYTSQALSILQAIWEASGYPWSVRLKALLPLWLPWAKKHFSISPPIERQLLQISARQIDRQIQSQKNPAQAASLRTHQTRHTAQTPHPHQNRLLERHHSRLYRNRPSLPFRQLRKRRVRALAYSHRHLLHLGRSQSRHGERPNRRAQRHARD